MNKKKYWLESKAFDSSLWLGTLAFAACFILIAKLIGFSGGIGFWGFLFLVVGFDVSHVYGTLYRVYMDKAERNRRPALYWGSLVYVYAISVTVYAISPKIFFSLLAYYAVYHFVKQHLGFIALYKHKMGEKNKLDYRLDKWAIYFATVYPVIWWHFNLPRNFSWFMDGDFIVLKQWIGRLVEVLGGNVDSIGQIQNGVRFIATEALFYLYIGVLGLYLGRQLYLYVRNGSVNPGKNMAMISTWIAWYLGIIHFNDDMIWNAFIILFHAIPYFALIWLYSKRKNMSETAETRGKWLYYLSKPGNWAVFLLFLFVIAVFEEVFWDVFVWGQYLLSPLMAAISDYSELSKSLGGSVLIKGGWTLEMAGRISYIIWVPLLSLPQIVHYHLDSEIWKTDGRNPDLKKYLHLE